jgi:serine/threonine protein kinase
MEHTDRKADTREIRPQSHHGGDPGSGQRPRRPAVGASEAGVQPCRDRMRQTRVGSAPWRHEKRAKLVVKSVTGAAFNASPLAPGYKLDRYELLCPIAEGGMASVWVARQRGKHGFEKLVAIKTILPKFASDVRFQEMFLDEARIASRIEHANVAQIFDLGEENEILYLAMEYVEGDALSKLNRACQRKGLRIPTGVLLRVLSDTCAGLHEAHEMRDASGRPLEIVHRDVSPHNILVSTKGTAKLIDFGIATARSRAGAETSSGVLKGKIQYMAPEQALGQRLDRRADIWAVGAILYTLLTGKPPFEGENPLATLHLLGSGRPPMPLPSSVHPAISTIVRRALSFAADHRYPTAADLREAIERAMVAAQCMTTPSEVAVFAATHLSDRIEKRRASVDAALAAAAAREHLHPPEERGRPSSLLPGFQTGSPPWPPPSSGMLPSPLPASAKTRAEAPAAKPASLETLARLTPRLSEPPPNASSYATIGSAALDASIQTGKSRKGIFALVGAIVLAGGGAAGISFSALRPGHDTPAVNPPPTQTASAMLAKSAPLANPTADTGDAATSASAWPLMPTIALSSLPRAVPQVAPPPPPRRPAWTAGPRRRPDADNGQPEVGPEPPAASAPAAAPAPPPPPTPPTPAPAKTIDDGF